jgi:hypothetical protein
MPDWLKALLDLLARLFAPKPPPPGPTGPTGPTLPTGPTGPAPAPKPVTKDTDFRAIGNTTRQAFEMALGRTVGDGPNPDLSDESGRIYALLEPKGLTRLYAAQAWHERHNDTYTPDEAYYPHSWKNVLATKSGGGFMSFQSYTLGARYWSERILDRTGPYANARTLAEFIHIYAPSSDGNDEAKYVADVVKQVNSWPLVGAPPPSPTGPTGPTGPLPPGLVAHNLAGTNKPLWLPDDVAFEVKLTELDAIARPTDRRPGANRSGKPMLWAGVTQHETGNERAGTDARMHAQWQFNGTPGHTDANGNPDRVGVHLYVDDKRVVQCLPVDEKGVHSGDWKNDVHVAVELCVNADRNRARAERNAAALMAGLLDILGKTALNAMYPHRSPPGSGCPKYLGQRWPDYEREVDRRLTAMRPGPAKG